MTKKPSRRDFLKTSTAAAAVVAFPHISCGEVEVAKPMTRLLGRTGWEVTSLGLGGQASIQWTGKGIDPVAIIVKSIDSGVNYLDTSNVYGPSQVNYGKAFEALNLIPGRPNYDESLRRSLYLASKTMIRHAKGSSPDVRDRTEGSEGSKAVDDIRRSLSQIFGDGKGAYPEGSYIDLFQIHNLNTMEEVEAIYLGLDDPDPESERIGTLAALLDYRDGTNRTGLNPEGERLIRKIGITGHISSPVMMECLQRDSQEIIDAMLIAINANDRRYLSHQYNAMAVAEAKNVGMIAMKVFSDGAMYTKEPRWSRTPEDVVHVVGTPELPSRPLIEYALTTPGVGTAIIGIGTIDSDERNCQLAQNLSSAQVRQDSLSETDRREIEELALRARKGKTNWFQLPQQGLGAPRELQARVRRDDQGAVTRLTWQTAYAAGEPILHYEVLQDGRPVGQVEHRPQTSKEPFVWETNTAEAHQYRVVTVDRGGRKTPSENVEPDQA